MISVHGGGDAINLIGDLLRRQVGFGRLNNQLCFFFVVEWILVVRLAEEFRPVVCVEVGKGVDGSRDSCEPVVEDDMELRGNVTGGDVEDDGDRGRMFVGESNIHATNGARLPAWKFLSIGHALV